MTGDPHVTDPIPPPSPVALPPQTRVPVVIDGHAVIEVDWEEHPIAPPWDYTKEMMG